MRKNKINKAASNVVPKNYGKTHYNSSTGKGEAQHHQQCQELLGRATGWQRIFLSQLLSQQTINIYQSEKLARLAKELEGRESRLCRYCNSSSTKSQGYYYCPQCGECVDFDFMSHEIAGGEYHV